MATDLNREALPPCDPLIVPAGDFVATASRYIAEVIRLQAENRPLVALALSGGKGPRPIYRVLATERNVPWDRVAIYFADERAVPPGDAESNFRLVKETLLDRLPVAVAAVHRMEAERSDLAVAAAEYDRVLPPSLDLLLLGIGEDGHTASLFPRHPALQETRRRVLGVQGPAEPRWRMTITPPVIHAARSRLMLVSGDQKAEAVARACRGPYGPMDCPAQLARNATWLVDEPAASRLRFHS